MTTQNKAEDATSLAAAATDRPGYTRPVPQSSRISMMFVGESTGTIEYVRGLLDRIRALGAEIIYLRYEGAHGRVVISETVLRTMDGRSIFGVPPDLREEFRYVCVFLLEMRFFGWQRGTGAKGRFEWDVVSDSLTHWHAQRPGQDAPETGVSADEDWVPF
jgi:hypothetical protein